ncbi:hypothetical protein CEV08_06710 [Bartonella tribocorum]|uniref:Uncharacterized protein n=1 Tax=Bartonella tribocorum TaxID=85701 RepID=A0A2M6USJ8_9HYPH|nr:hypothetical protein CEV08_06710 [Bartonella tribocorum]
MHGFSLFSDQSPQLSTKCSFFPNDKSILLITNAPSFLMMFQPFALLASRERVNLASSPS